MNKDFGMLLQKEKKKKSCTFQNWYSGHTS